MSLLPRALCEGVSDCCHGPLLVAGKTTRYWVCGICQKACGRVLEDKRD
jgi:hypothetical protein